MYDYLLYFLFSAKQSYPSKRTWSFFDKEIWDNNMIYFGVRQRSSMLQTTTRPAAHRAQELW